MVVDVVLGSVDATGGVVGGTVGSTCVVVVVDDASGDGAGVVDDEGAVAG